MYAIRSFHLFVHTHIYEWLFISFISKTGSWGSNCFFFNESTWANWTYLWWPLHFTLSHSFDNNLNGSLLLFIYVTSWNLFIFWKSLQFSTVWNLNQYAQAHHQLLCNTPKYTCMHIDVWTLMLWPDLIY